jgi:hypothetical protein
MMRLLTIAAVAFTALTLPVAATTASECAPPLGTTELLARPERFLIFGEMHGTAEGPKYFAEITCEAAKTGPLTVGIEFPDSLQPDLDAFFDSSGDEAATNAFRTAFQRFDYGDGRGSIAMLHMIERLQKLKAEGAPIRVAAFILPEVYDPNETDLTQTPYEKQMAKGIVAAAGDQRIVVLVGNIHALRTPFDDFKPMAMHLPAEETLSLNLVSSGGEAWNCMDECGSNPMRAIREGPPQIFFTPSWKGGFNAEWHIGRSTAASPVKQSLGAPIP